MDERKIIYTYNKAWNVERRIYSVGDFKLARPIAIDTLLYAMLGVIIALILSRLPLISSYPAAHFALWVIGMPMAMKKARIHSKTPFRFLVGCAEYLMQPKAMTRFQPVKEDKPIRFTNVRHKPF